MKRAIVIGACLFAAFALVNYLEFHSWFYNNEMPAYLRAGVTGGDASEAIRAFYQASHDACTPLHPLVVGPCQRMQLGLLGDAPFARPISNATGFLLTAIAPYIELVQAIKIAIITLAMGSALLCALMIVPFLAGLDGRALAAIGLVWVGGWVATRGLYMGGAGRAIILVTFLEIAAALVVLAVYTRVLPSIPIKSLLRLRTPNEYGKLATTSGLGVLAIILCFGLGYYIHVLFRSNFPLLYLFLAIGFWPLLYRALPKPGSWILCGFWAAALYLMTSLVSFFYDLSLPKQHQISLTGILIFVAIWRDDTRVFWVLPLLLLFDMQNAPRLCALIIVAEGFVGLSRRQMPTAIVPATLTAIIGVATTMATNIYPFDERLYSISDALGVLLSPVVLTAALVAVVIIWTATRRRPEDSESSVALDRMLIYSAGVVVMAGIQIPTLGLLFDAFQLSNLFQAVATAPVIAVFSVTVGLLLRSYRNSTSDYQKWSVIATIASLLFLMTMTKGRDASLSQLRDGLRSTFTPYLPADWPRGKPSITLDNNVVYFDTENILMGPLAQYSMLKILLLSRNADFSRDKLTILPFPAPSR